MWCICVCMLQVWCICVCMYAGKYVFVRVRTWLSTLDTWINSKIFSCRDMCINTSARRHTHKHIASMLHAKTPGIRWRHTHTLAYMHAYTHSGFCYYDADDYWKAMEAYIHTCIHAYTQPGFCYHDAKDYWKAIEAFQKAYQLRFEHAGAGCVCHMC